jgi:hypothetical protein
MVYVRSIHTILACDVPFILYVRYNILVIKSQRISIVNYLLDVLSKKINNNNNNQLIIILYNLADATIT